MFQDFKNFALRGNVVDLAVGVIIGAAFGKIVSSLVDDIIMPIIGKLSGGLDFSNYYYSFSQAVHSEMTYEEAKRLGAAIGYGQFATIVVNFLIVAVVLFFVIRQFEKLKRPAPEAASPPPRSEVLLEEIRDAIRGMRNSLSLIRAIVDRPATTDVACLQAPQLSKGADGGSRTDVRASGSHAREIGRKKLASQSV